MKCLLCQSQNHRLFESVTSFGFPLVYFQCEDCGFIFQSFESSQAADPEFYAETYRKIYQDSPEPTPKDLYVQNERAKHLIGFLNKQHVRSVNRALDIGASSGKLLLAYQLAFDCEVAGIEPGDAYRQYAESRGLEMHSSIEALVTPNAGRFDLISLIHVLEHLPEPVGILQTLREKLLADDGHLLIEVPNFYAHDSYELAHLSCFTPKSLKAVMKRAGFRVLRLKRHGEPRSDLLNLYLTVLAVPEENKMRSSGTAPERFVGLKRRLGMLYRRLVQKFFPRKAWRPLPDEIGS